MKPIVVLDTCILVAALRSNRGASYQILRALGSNQFDIALSVPLLLEYEAVLSRDSIGISLDERGVGTLLDYICSIGKPHDIHFMWRPVLKDPSDEFVLELAVKASCQYIVTHNIKDFVGVEKFGLDVIRPGAFLLALGENQ